MEDGMNTVKVDRRVKYTKMVLKESLTKLMKEKAISRITITEICKNADINRTTFYSHYNDQYDLLEKIVQELINDINKYLDTFEFDDNIEESLQMLTKILEYIDLNSDLCKVLLGSNSNLGFQKDIMMIMNQRCISEWVIKNSIDKTTADYIYAFAITGNLGIIQKWLSEKDKKSAKEMASIIMKLTYHGLNAFI